MQSEKEEIPKEGAKEEQIEEQKQKEEEDKEYLKPDGDESGDRFDDMGLKEEVLRGIYGYGFNKPSPIQ